MPYKDNEPHCTIMLKGKWIKTHGELKRAIDPKLIVYFTWGSPDDKDSECICGVNFKATAEKAGMTAEQSKYDSFMFFFDPLPAN